MAVITKKSMRSSSGMSTPVKALLLFVSLVLAVWISFVWLPHSHGHSPPSSVLSLSIHSANATTTNKVAAKSRAMARTASALGENRACTTNCVIDILSIGSNTRPELMEAQKKTFASHVSVRNFFAATEDDDDDPDCGKHLLPEDALQISIFCRKTRYFDPVTQAVMDQMQHFFAKPKYLQDKGSVAGKWMCAQRRPIFGLYKAFQAYQGNVNNLPDYLIVVDDDTYFNLELFPSYMTDATPRAPRVTPGCLLRFKHAKLTAPYGGMSTMFNRASLAYMMTPMFCPRDTAFCQQVRGNQVGERHMFQNGMSLIDLMHTYVSSYPYREYRTWNETEGYCLHSDWAVGYFVNFYNASRHVTIPMLNDTTFGHILPQDRMEAWHGSWGYSHLGRNFCKNDGNKFCQPKSVVCHYISADRMAELNNAVKADTPNRFRQAIQ
jgi:hypothetical protein